MRRWTLRSRLFLFGLGTLLTLSGWIGTVPPFPLYAQGVLTARYENLPLGGGRLTVTINVAVQRWNQLYIQVAPTDVAAAFRVRTPGWQIVDVIRDEFGRTMLLLRRAQPKMGLETVIIEGPEGRGRRGVLALAREGFRFLTVTSEPSFLPVELPPPARGGGAAQLRRFDVNGNDRLDDPEFFAAIDAWIAGTLDDATFFLAIDLWVSQRPLSSVGGQQISPSGFLQVRVGPSGVRFVPSNLSGHGTLPAVRVRVYDLQGRLVFAQDTPGTPLQWDFLGTDGRRVANGVYLYEVSLQGRDGRAPLREVGWLLVLR